MPNPKLSDQYKGKSFGEISKIIQEKYKDRNDTISNRGRMAEMESLRQAQETAKAKQEVQQQLQQAMQQAQNPQQQQQDPMQQMQGQMQGQMPMQSGLPTMEGQSAIPQMGQQERASHPASQSYNEQFAMGGLFENDSKNPLFNTNNYAPIIPKEEPNNGINKYLYPDLNRFNPSSQESLDTPVPMEGEQIIQSLIQQLNSIVNASSKKQTPARTRKDFQPIEGGLTKSMARNNHKMHMDQVLNSQANLQKELAKVKTPGVQGYAAGAKPDTSYGTPDAKGNLTKMNPLRYAPMLSNIINMASAKKPDSVKSQMEAMGYKTSVDENLANRISPRQTQFSNIDTSQLQRGITNQARGFTQNNINASGGNAGMFMSNELANQGNVMDATGKAMMQAAQMDRQTEAMNAGERGRIDQFLQGQNAQQTSAQQANVGIGMQLADLDARNLGAFNTNKSANLTGLFSNLGALGKEKDQMKMIGNAFGYNSFGDYLKGLPEDQRQSFIANFFKMIG